jgi:hypothetical protein
MPPPERHYDTNDASVFLTQQAADAQAAMQQTIATMKTTAQGIANVRWWTQQYPWYAVGAAAVLGFTTATQVLASTDQRTQSAPPVQSQPVAQTSWLAPLFDLIRSTLMSAIIGAIHTSGEQAGQTQAESQPR